MHMCAVYIGRSIVTGKLKSKSQWGTKQRCNTNRGLKETAFSREFSVGSPGQDGIVSLAAKFNGIFARSCGCRLIHDISGFNATQTIPAVAKEASFEYVRYWDVVDPGNTETGGFAEGWFVFLRFTPADGHISIRPWPVHYGFRVVRVVGICRVVTTYLLSLA